MKNIELLETFVILSSCGTNLITGHSTSLFGGPILNYMPSINHSNYIYIYIYVDNLTVKLTKKSYLGGH
jgi:hypothetical protein